MNVETLETMFLRLLKNEANMMSERHVWRPGNCHLHILQKHAKNFIHYSIHLISWKYNLVPRAEINDFKIITQITSDH